MTTPMPDRTPTGDLRERLANTLHCPTCGVEPGEHCLRAREDNLHPHMTRVQAADAVLPVVEAALAQQAAEIDEDIIKPERALHEQTIQRAEQAERQRDEARLVAASLADNGPEHLATIERAEQAERQRDAALAVLRDLTDGRPCAPHPGNGWCQTHGERAPCPHAEARRLLAARDAEKPEETTPAQHTPGANAEDCPACSGRRDLPYPFICPGAALDQPEETPQ